MRAPSEKNRPAMPVRVADAGRQPDSRVPQVQTDVVVLSPALYLFRYATQAGSGNEMPITVHGAPSYAGIVDFFPGEGVSRNTLRKLGDTLVVRVIRNKAAVLIAKYRIPGVTDGEDASVQIDRVDTSGRFIRQPKDQPGELLERHDSATKRSPISPQRPPDRSGNPKFAASPSAPAGVPQYVSLKYLGHIQNRGDVTVSGGWLGIPSGQDRLEGFSIEWPHKPVDVELFYGCVIRGVGQTPLQRSGQFAGTRQKGAPVLSISFALGGPGAARYELTGQVAFSGCMPVPLIAGHSLSGPSGKEPLVALKIEIARCTEEATTPHYASPWDDPAITQIFRQTSGDD